MSVNALECEVSKLVHSDACPRPTAGELYFDARSLPPKALVKVEANNCPGRRGRLSALSVLLCKSVFYDVFVWARGALNRQKRRFPARAVCIVSARPVEALGRACAPPTLAAACSVCAAASKRTYVCCLLAQSINRSRELLYRL